MWPRKAGGSSSGRRRGGLQVRAVGTAGAVSKGFGGVGAASQAAVMGFSRLYINIDRVKSLGFPEETLISRWASALMKNLPQSSIAMTESAQSRGNARPDSSPHPTQPAPWSLTVAAPGKSSAGCPPRAVWAVCHCHDRGEAASQGRDPETELRVLAHCVPSAPEPSSYGTRSAGQYGRPHCVPIPDPCHLEHGTCIPGRASSPSRLLGAAHGPAQVPGLPNC